MKILLTFTLILATLLILTFSKFENILLDSGFSWSISKALPYFLLILCGVLITYSFSKIVVIKNKILKIFVGLVLYALPFSIGFLFNPIYSGDFSEKGTSVKAGKVYDEFKDAQLVVISIPGCPYCMESIGLQKKLLQRNSKMKINFIVCDSRPESTLEYKKEVGSSKINVLHTSNGQDFADLAGSSFPCFVIVKNGKAVMKWNNDSFGVGARDIVESSLKL